MCWKMFTAFTYTQPFTIYPFHLQSTPWEYATCYRSVYPLRACNFFYTCGYLVAYSRDKKITKKAAHLYYCSVFFFVFFLVIIFLCLLYTCIFSKQNTIIRENAEYYAWKEIDIGIFQDKRRQGKRERNLTRVLQETIIFFNKLYDGTFPTPY